MKKITVPVTKTLSNWIGILADQRMQSKESLCESIIREFVGNSISGVPECEMESEDDMVVKGFKGSDSE